MKFFSDIRLLILALWLGGAVFFISVAASAFSVLADQRELAGAVVNRNLSVLNYAGIVIATILILTSLVGTRTTARVGLWAERLLLVVMGVACAIAQFVINFWLGSVRAQMGRPLDEIAVDDPLRLQFNTLHEYSTWLLFAAMGAALIAFFIIANRRFGTAAKTTADVYDFSKEFKT